MAQLFCPRPSVERITRCNTIYCENQATSDVVTNSLFNEKKQIICLKYGYLNELICHKFISVIDVGLQRMLQIL